MELDHLDQVVVARRIYRALAVTVDVEPGGRRNLVPASGELDQVSRLYIEVLTDSSHLATAIVEDVDIDQCREYRVGNRTGSGLGFSCSRTYGTGRTNNWSCGRILDVCALIGLIPHLDPGRLAPYIAEVSDLDDIFLADKFSSIVIIHLNIVIHGQPRHECLVRINVLRYAKARRVKLRNQHLIIAGVCVNQYNRCANVQ